MASGALNETDDTRRGDACCTLDRIWRGFNLAWDNRPLFSPPGFNRQVKINVVRTHFSRFRSPGHVTPSDSVLATSLPLPLALANCTENVITPPVMLIRSVVNYLWPDLYLRSFPLTQFSPNLFLPPLSRFPSPFLPLSLSLFLSSALTP